MLRSPLNTLDQKAPSGLFVPPLMRLLHCKSTISPSVTNMFCGVILENRQSFILSIFLPLISVPLNVSPQKQHMLPARCFLSSRLSFSKFLCLMSFILFDLFTHINSLRFVFYSWSYYHYCYYVYC